MPETISYHGEVIYRTEILLISEDCLKNRMGMVYTYMGIILHGDIIHVDGGACNWKMFVYHSTVKLLLIREMMVKGALRKADGIADHAD